MYKKTFRLSLLFVFSTSIFIACFFQIISFPLLVIGLITFVSMLIRWLTNTPTTIWQRNKWLVVNIGLVLTIGIWWGQNSMMGLSFLILRIGMIYTFYDLNYYKNKLLRFTIRWYGIFGGFALSYFLGFATAASIIWSHDIANFDCSDIYKYYNLITAQSIAGTTWWSYITYHPLTWSQKTSYTLKELLKETPWLQSLYHKIQFYQQDIRSGITDQQQINKEICQLVTKRIHEAYQSNNIKIGLVLIVWLFLYPFFAILLYIYGFIAYCCIHGIIRLWRFTFKKRSVQSTRLE